LINFLAAQFSRPKLPLSFPGQNLPRQEHTSLVSSPSLAWLLGQLFLFSFHAQILAPVRCAFVPSNDSAAYNILLDFPFSFLREVAGPVWWRSSI
jgi:hypothetical protein